MFILLFVLGAACSDNGTSLLADSGKDVAISPDRAISDLSVVPEQAAGDGPQQQEAAITDGWTSVNNPACNGFVLACADGVDNDEDGLIDALDPECTGPCDNDEGSFEINIPGANSDACKQDCYWDDDSGGGIDGCEWNHKCDPLGPSANLQPACSYDEGYSKCEPEQPQKCLDFCIPLTPNGCDCFGCCEIFTATGKYAHTIYLGSGDGCTAATPEGCAPCTQVTTCLNTCGECELCLGKTINELPASCFPSYPDAGVGHEAGVGDGGTTPDMGPPMPACEPEVTPCLTNNDCPSGLYCITGCCVWAPQ